MTAPREEYAELFWEHDAKGRPIRLLFDDSAYRSDYHLAYDPELHAKLKGIPGCDLRKENGKWIWRLPHEVGRHFGFGVEGWNTCTYTGAQDMPLHDYQRGALNLVAELMGMYAAVVEHATGTGKSATAIAWAKPKIADNRRVLIVVPAVVVPNWGRELRKWGVDPTKVTVCSWHTLHKFCDAEYDLVILDELHNAKSTNSRMSKSLGKLRLRNPKVFFLSLTATLIMKEAEDLWHQLHCLWPGRFGTYWQFARRYCLLDQNEHGVGVYGLNPEHQAELRWRLDALAHTVTKDQVAHLLPKLNILMRYVKKPRVKDLKAVFEKATSSKQDSVVDLFLEAQAEGQKKLVCMTHYRSTAADAATALRAAGFKVWHTSGEHTAEVRDGIIEDWKAAPEGVLVVTMFSVKEGIRLSGAETVAYLELLWAPGRAAQSLGRFTDINMAGKTVNVFFIVVENSAEERQAAVLERRYREASILRGSDKEKLDTQAALVVQVDEQALLDELSAIAEELPDFDFGEDE